MLFQEASKLHIVLSSYQRPVITNTNKPLEGNLIWNMDEHVGLTSYDEEFSELTNFYSTLKEEALKTAQNITDDTWYSVKKENSATNYITTYR